MLPSGTKGLFADTFVPRAGGIRGETRVEKTGQKAGCAKHLYVG